VAGKLTDGGAGRVDVADGLLRVEPIT